MMHVLDISEGKAIFRYSSVLALSRPCLPSFPSAFFPVLFHSSTSVELKWLPALCGRLGY
jgi:hypothetical protein